MVKARHTCTPAPRTSRIRPNAGRPADGTKTKGVSIHVFFFFLRAGLEAHCCRIPECSALLHGRTLVEVTRVPP